MSNGLTAAIKAEEDEAPTHKLSNIIRINKMSKQVYTLIAVELDKNGNFDKIIDEPEYILARDEQDAVVKFTAKKAYTFEDREVKILCHPF